ncbi:hypothetical protein ABTX61_04245, partial [Amycolatopsis japonica]
MPEKRAGDLCYAVVTAGERLRVITRSLLPVLWTFAALAVIASAAEIWRYVLLVQSRDSALST